MKRILAIILTIVCILSVSFCFADTTEAPEIAAEAALLLNLDTGEVLFEKNAHEKHYPASMTKMLTCILALERLDMNKRITVRSEDIKGVNGNGLNLAPGEEIDIGILLSGTMVVSANDGAAVLAHEVAGTQEAFAELMNKKAAELGCTDSNFVNPHGLHDRDHYSTCYDIAAIAKYGLRSDVFRRIVGRSEFTVPGTNKSADRYLKSTNLLLYDQSSENMITVNGEQRYCKYDGCIGIKTGYTPQAGGCLCSAVEKDGTTLLCVVMASTDLGRFEDSVNLFEWGFKSAHSVKVLDGGYKTGTIKLKKATPKKLNTELAEDAFVALPTDANVDLLDTKVTFDENIKLPLHKGDRVGSLQIYKDTELLAEYDVVASSDAFAKTSTGFFTKLLIVIAILIILLIVATVLYFIADKRRNDQRKARIAARRAAAAEQEAMLKEDLDSSDK